MKNKKSADLKEKHSCECEENSCEKECTCDENCTCGCQDGNVCTCDGDCHCGCHCEDECHCDENCECGCGQDDCTCGDECTCDEEHDCGCHGHGKHHHASKEGEYLAIAQRLQADFENYRKHVAEQLDRERHEGVKSVIEAFLPCLDTFKEAKKNIDDEKIMSGINMIENKILDTLKSLKVEKIEAVGKVYDPHKHNVISVMSNPDKDDDVVLEEYQSGWTLDGKVIRYSKVVVNKRS